MVQANELRIGNWISWNFYKGGNVGMVDAIVDYPNKKMINLVNSGIKNAFSVELIPGEFDPIPLTPEILVACGFKKHDNSNEYWTFYNLPNNWYIAQSHHNEPSAGVKEGCFYWGDQYKEVKFLHRLQNLVFELMDIELVYSPVK